MGVAATSALVGNLYTTLSGGDPINDTRALGDALVASGTETRTGSGSGIEPRSSG